MADPITLNDASGLYPTPECCLDATPPAENSPDAIDVAQTFRQAPPAIRYNGVCYALEAVPVEADHGQFALLVSEFQAFTYLPKQPPLSTAYNSGTVPNKVLEGQQVSGSFTSPPGATAFVVNIITADLVDPTTIQFGIVTGVCTPPLTVYSFTAPTMESGTYVAQVVVTLADSSTLTLTSTLDYVKNAVYDCAGS